MLIHNTEHTFVYIDPTLSVEDAANPSRDGSTAALALRHFPNTIEDNKIYLIRRSATEQYADFPYNNSSTLTFSDVKSLVIMGMPKSDDKLFASMPADAKAAWVDADREWAWVRHPGNGRYSTSFPDCENFHMSRVCFQDNREDYDAVCVSLSSDYGTNMYFDHCRFKYSRFDFTAEGSSTSFNYYRGFRMISGGQSNWGNSGVIKNCQFDKWGYSWLVDLGRVRNIRVDDSIFNCAQTYNAGTPAISWTTDEGYNTADVVANNLTYNAYYSSSNDGWELPPIMNGWVNRATVKNVTVQMGEHQNFTPYQSRFGINCIVAFDTWMAGSLIENVTVNLPELVGRMSTVVYINHHRDNNDTRYQLPSRGQYNIVRNITVNGRQEYVTSNLYPDFSEWNQNPWQDNDRGIIRLVTSGGYSRAAANDYLVQGLHINVPMGCALQLYDTMIDLSDCDIKGSVYLNSSVGKIKSLQSWYPGNVITDGGRNSLYIGAITCNKDNPRWEYNSQYAVRANWHSYILCGNCNVRYVTNAFDTNDAGYAECSYICTSNMREGNYTVRSKSSQVQTWSVYRVGSDSTCSLRLSNEIQDDAGRPIKIGGAPFKGITKHVTAGDHTLTFYLALYGYNNTDDIKKRFQVVINLPDGTQVFSQAGNWFSDTSTWENVDGATAYRVEIPFTMAAEGDITVSYTWYWYMVDAATFVDPFPVIS